MVSLGPLAGAAAGGGGGAALGAGAGAGSAGLGSGVSRPGSGSLGLQAWVVLLSRAERAQMDRARRMAGTINLNTGRDKPAGRGSRGPPVVSGAGMSRVWVWMWVLACAGMVPAAAQAQGNRWGGMLDLPLVVKEQGWARYAVTTNEGEPAEVVVKVGAPDRHKGKAGRWIAVETNMPEVGKVTLEMLVVGKLFTPMNLVKARARMPGQPAQESEPKGTPAKPYTPRVIKTGTEQVVGQTLSVTEYGFPEGMTAVWSAAVPGLGIVRTTGQQPMRLVAFGVGGDPWKGSVIKPVWPVDSARPPAP